MNRLITSLVIAILIIAVTPSAITATEGTQIDIQHYKLDIQIYPEKQQFNVQTTITINAIEDEINTVNFLLNPTMKITNIMDNEGNTLYYKRYDDQLNIYLINPLEKSQQTQITIEYYGISKAEEKFGKYGFGGYIGEEGSYMIYESAWYPMVWGDRYTVTTKITVPKDQIGISVGELTEEKEMGLYKEFTWEATIPTRGISFATGKYKVKSSLLKHKTVDCYTYPDTAALADKCLKTASEIGRASCRERV